MKSFQAFRIPAMPIGIRQLFPAMVAGASMLSAATEAADTAKTYTLFMGESIAVEQAGALRPVRDVSGGSWVVVVGGQPVLVSTKNGPIKLKMSPSLKLTDVSANISKLKSEPAYTFANDPSVRLTRSLNQAADLNAGFHAAASQTTATQVGALSSLEMGNGTAPNGGPGAALHDTTVQQTLNYEQSAVDAAGNSAGWDLFYRGSKNDSDGYDALDVSFDISAARRLAEPFIVVITRFHEKGAGAGTSRNLVYAKALDPIEAKAASVHFEQAGFPPGYELQGFEIHLYNRGDEVATNVAPKRVAFTGDEAFDYVKAAYLRDGKGKTLPAVPVMAGALPADLPERLASGKYGETFYVRVSKDGLADKSFADAACSREIEDPYLKSVVRGLRFTPALDQGRPVDGVAPVNLSRLRI